MSFTESLSIPHRNPKRLKLGVANHVVQSRRPYRGTSLQVITIVACRALFSTGVPKKECHLPPIVNVRFLPPAKDPQTPNAEYIYVPDISPSRALSGRGAIECAPRPTLLGPQLLLDQ